MCKYSNLKILKTIFLVIFILTGSLCSTITTNEKSEGLTTKTSFRVYVRIDSLEIKDMMTDDEVNKFLIEQGIKRYEVIWNGVILLNGKNISKDVYNSVLHSKDNAEIYYRKEREDYVEAYVDFQMENTVIEFCKQIYPLVITDKDDNDDWK